MVIDASAAVEFLLGTTRGLAVRRHLFTSEGAELRLHAPSHLDTEVVQALRRLEATGAVSAERAHMAVATLTDLPVIRHPITPLVPRMWALRPNLTAYDAAYVALAEGLGCPLLTLDARMARAPGSTASIVLAE